MTRTLRCFCMLLLAMALACAGDESAPTPDASSLRTLDQGSVVGSASEGVHVWRGIPFAKPPVGELRWRPPQAPEPWAGTLEALSYGEECVQRDPSGDPTGSEDCLTLNVFAPRFEPGAVPATDDRLPVMVFIHGGGNSMGSSHVYDASRLARENRVIVVTVHYRLGVLGWFSHPALLEGRRRHDESSGNWATLDLVRSLEWVRDHIAAFGGDPGRVTIFGESAGGINVFSLLLSPRARGLFHRAISQSGFPTTFTRAQAQNLRDADEPGEAGSSSEVLLSLLEQDGLADDREEARRVVAEMKATEVASYLYSKTPEELLGVFGDGFGPMYVAPFVIRDGHVIPDRDPLEVLRRGHHNRVPTILGTNRDEHKLFMAFLSPYVRRIGFLPLGFRDAERYDLVTSYGGLLWKALGADEPAAAMRGSQAPGVFGYRFDWDEQPDVGWIDQSRLIGAGHALELLFVFGGTHWDFARRWVLEDPDSAERLSREMRSYWTQFAASGEPGRGQDADLPEWKAWGRPPDEPRFMVFDSERDRGLHLSNETLDRESLLARVAADPRLVDDDKRCEIYRLFVQWSDLMTPARYAEVEDGACAPWPLPGRTMFD